MAHFNRRSALGLMGAAGLAALWRGSVARAQNDDQRRQGPQPPDAPQAPQAPQPPQAPAYGVFRKTAVGNFQAYALTDGGFFISPIQPVVAPEADAKDLDAVLEAACLPKDKVLVPVTPLLIDTGKDKVLVDFGFGVSEVQTAGKAINALRAAGVNPEDITALFLSHAHGDHYGGLFNSDGSPFFPNAQYMVTKLEQEFWSGAKPDFSKSRLDEKTRDEMIKGSAEAVTNKQGNWKTLQNGDALAEGVKIVLAPGHTPGHSVIEIESDGQKLVHIVDLAHSNVIMFHNPDWTIAYDTDHALAAKTRKEWFTKITAEKTRVFGYHLPFPGFGHITQGPQNDYIWVPEPWDVTTV
jgi:glyoxylase-like metal-dependent hydrolase (beta-lactamase superfamily II)